MSKTMTIDAIAYTSRVGMATQPCEEAGMADGFTMMMVGPLHSDKCEESPADRFAARAISLPRAIL